MTTENIAIDKIIFSRNIRSSYNDNGLKELCQSLKKDGILQPVGVYPVGAKYQLLYGHRRCKAAQMAGITAIPCVIRPEPKNDLERLLLQIEENDQREDISPEDRENAILRLENECGMLPEEICKRFNKSAGWYSQIKGAHEFRARYGSLFKESGIPLTTKDAYEMRNWSEEKVKELIANLTNEDNQVKKSVRSKLMQAKERKQKTKTAAENELSMFFSLKENKTFSLTFNKPACEELYSLTGIIEKSLTEGLRTAGYSPA